MSYFLFSNMTDSTSITQLPIDPANGGSINPISQPNDPMQSSNADTSRVMALDNSTIQQIVNVIQKAATSGSTALPSRDIPQTTENIMNDPNSNINYIPKEQKYDLDPEEDEEEITYTYNKNQKQNMNLEYYYEILQIPILISILFFLFQIPVVKKLILINLPFLSKTDGNMNLHGLLFYSVLFGVCYFVLSILILK